MDHYIAYHSVELMGHDYSPGDTFDYRSRKPERYLRGSLGAMAWLIVGLREAKRTKYRLDGVHADVGAKE